jgi:hypothetical protein
VFTVAISGTMALSDPKVRDKRNRLYYRHLHDLRPGAVLGKGAKGRQRLWKWGSESQLQFERWTRAIRGNIDRQLEVCLAHLFCHVL